MTDDFYNPQYISAINDSESQDEIEEKPIEDNTLDQIMQNNTNIQQNYNPPDINKQDNKEEIPDQIQ